MQVVLPPGGDVLPGAAPEHRGPVVGLLPVHRVVPDVVVGLVVVPGGAGLHEPGVLVGGVVHHQVHNQLHAPAVAGVPQALPVLHGAEFLHDLLVPGDVVAVVVVGGLIDRREPDGVYAQLFQIVQFLQHPGQVADPVAVGIAEAAGVHLVDHQVFDPVFFRYH